MARQISLYIGASFEAAWENVLLPWFESVSAKVFQNRQPVAVVTPFTSHSAFLRAKLLDHGVSLLGVHFLVPAQLREFLQTGETPRVPLREHFRLLLSAAAEQCASEFQRDQNNDDFQITKAVAREPDELLRAIDAGVAAGARLADFASPAVARIGRRFEQIVKDCGCALVAEADRLLLQSARGEEARFEDLFITGFDAAHWPLWPLLRAAAHSAKNTIVMLREPRHEAGELDRTWISTWEEEFGPAQQLAPLVAEPRFAPLLALPETATEIDARKNNPLADARFVLGRDSNEQARAIIALALGFLSDPSCKRLAILLPGPGAVARLTANSLQKLRIPHNDVIAHRMRGTFDDEEWRAWLEFQERSRLEPLLRFLAQSPAAIALFAPLSLRQIQNTLRRACGDILINSADVLCEYCRSKKDESNYQPVAKGLSEIRFLPERATLKKFVKAAAEIFRALKWRERLTELKRLAGGWSEGLIEDLPREHFLRWLSEIFGESSLSRHADGDHPYARVQLLRYDQAEGAAWSHVIFGGLNEGIWPPSDHESPFLPDDQIAALNKRNTSQSVRFGEGQQIAREGATLCVGARERRVLALRQLLNVIESTTQGIGVAAERYVQSPREQAINPSDFFARLYFSARGEALSQCEITGIHEQTQHWLAQIDLFKSAEPAEADVKRTAVAYRERRRPRAEFGEYEFAFPKDCPPAQKVSLSATDVGNLLQRPALVWTKAFLGLEAEELHGDSWSPATGQWVHRWLAVVGAPGENRFVPRPSADEIVRRVMAAADHFRSQVLSLLNACGRAREPDWWRSGWRNARHLAEQFARQLTATEDWPQLAAEWKLGSRDLPHIIRLNNGVELRVRGRVDLILARDEAAQEIWIVDYKTGEAKPLKAGSEDLRKQLIEGNGVQICLYALALYERGGNIRASLLTRDDDLNSQITLAQILAQNGIWQEIARMENTGIFGMRGELRSEFEFTGIYPLATLAIDRDLLETKWEQTHPPLAKPRNK